MILYLDETQTMTRVKIYELLSILVSLDNVQIHSEIAEQTNLLQCILSDIEKFDSNSTVLSVLFNLVTKLVIQSTLPDLTVKIIDEM